MKAVSVLQSLCSISFLSFHLWGGDFGISTQNTDGLSSHASSASPETGDSLSKLYDVPVVHFLHLYKDTFLPHGLGSKQMTLSDWQGWRMVHAQQVPTILCGQIKSPEVRLWYTSLCPGREKHSRDTV